MDIKIVAIAGSFRQISYTRMGLQFVLKELQKMGIATELLDLRKYKLPFAMQFEGQKNPEDVDKLKAAVQAADGIIWGTPEYHGSYSGVLKNAIDLMGSDEFRNKTIGLLGVGGGAMGSVNALAHLRAVGRNLHAWVIPQEVSIPQASNKFDRNGNCTDEAIYKRMQVFAQEMAKTTLRFSMPEITTLLDTTFE